MTHADKIHAARFAHTAAQLAHVELLAAMEAWSSENPEPELAIDDARWVAWSDAYDAHRAALDGDAIDAARKSTTIALIEALEAWTHTHTREADLAFDAALGRGRAISFKARRKLIDLGHRLDLSTVA
jgi:hypothetical protein